MLSTGDGGVSGEGGREEVCWLEGARAGGGEFMEELGETRGGGRGLERGIAGKLCMIGECSRMVSM